MSYIEQRAFLLVVLVSLTLLVVFVTFFVISCIQFAALSSERLYTYNSTHLPKYFILLYLFVIIGLSSHRQSPSSLSVMAAGDGTFPSLAMQPQGA